MATLDRRIAVVTGGSRGLGRAVVLELARRGAYVVINYRRREQEARDTLEQLRSDGGEGSVYQADVTDPRQVQRMFQEVFGRHRRLDILVNNAGILRDAYFLLMSASDWWEVLDVDLNGVFHCSKAAVRIMAGHRSGVIINIGSGLVAQLGQVNHNAAKQGLVGFSRALAREVGPKGIRVMHVAPGFFKTEMSEALNKSMIDATFQLTPLERWGEPRELAALVGFLASDDARCFSGQTIAIDGGRGAVEAEYGL
ncbi:MAG: 3-oxoacyl-ACP reductase FabG [Candidatus Competibacteraceae bacterium]|nr:3-oxoacyl-ACP reductase FabG [Candidatus Competibacteraceae bacterium]MBK8899417.1 3-oxoacyl-ACP reductase FabG [Candidatus Competibacteraceae bacterium]MBK8964422.1 3-oxoacyl-ACP reductase FabG [Candidatus Competibacteraceae bacterium]MBK9952411.1 3-oxoacyl-ACP reductase FabG [Candidatus Competibacteraceae bacterium]